MAANNIKKVRVSICMGSSCFSRGNNHTLEILRNYIESHDLADRVQLEGKLCEGRCCDGPNIVMDDVPYERVDHSTVIDILEHHLRELCAE